jgi:hypothetical protein
MAANPLPFPSTFTCASVPAPATHSVICLPTLLGAPPSFVAKMSSAGSRNAQSGIQEFKSRSIAAKQCGHCKDPVVKRRCIHELDVQFCHAHC